MTCHSSDSTESIEHESRSRTETQVAESEQQSRIATARRDLKNTVQCGVPDHILPTVPIKLLLLNQLAAHLGLEWKSVLLDLSLSSADLYCCCADHLLSVHSQVLAGLVMWKQRNGIEATVQRLLQSLQTSHHLLFNRCLRSWWRGHLRCVFVDATNPSTFGLWKTLDKQTLKEVEHCILV
ncbi:uncharacterized protein LOC127637625 isoform X4 [Xyrauchen texanus]|uniref:uncharacterized protein LOC127637625 isoform X4 n=1 Tax=Xyrauchen texanus TaxID=154827 RepID=UPI002241A15D|nr:uncharacterized protein LOC127637625 isoform X4 [Xyrauchen texanus]